MRRFLARSAADQSGAAAVEFALIFPILFALNVGAIEALQVYQVQRNVAHAAATMADVTAQARTVTEAELQDVLSSGVSIMYPFPQTSLQQRLTSVSADDRGTTKTEWTSKRAYSGSGGATVPAGYLGANESVIVADVIYDYRPAFRMFMPESLRFTRQAYARPRLTLKVDKVDS